MPENIRVSEVVSESELKASFAGVLLGEDSYDVLVAGTDTDVWKPDGQRLLSLRTNAIPASACNAAFPVLREASEETNNRGLAAGEIPQDVAGFLGRGPIGKRTRSRFRAIKADGTLSNTNLAMPVMSGIIGYYERNSRFPYCRQTAFNLKHPERFERAMPLIRAVDRVFAKNFPERHAAQLAAVQASSSDFVINGTAFSTVTVNRNWQTAVHKDAGDFKDGFGVLCALRAGRFDGCYLCFPRYRVAVDIRNRDVLLADVHEWHGNTPMQGVPGCFERVSCVFYFREGIQGCESAAAELDRVKLRKPGDPIFQKKGDV